MKQIKVHYFAVLKDFTGKSEEIIVTQAERVSEVFQEICKKYNFKMPEAQLRAAINDDFCDWDQLINHGDKIVFIPPVSGG